jgi:lactosylceramide 4-alpha-galactosyltransferase
LPAAPASAVKIGRNSKKASAKRNKSLLKLLLRSTPQTRRFAARADELFAAPCAARFFVTWLSPLAQFGRRELLVMESLFRWHRGACLLVASDTMDSAGGRDRLRPFLDCGLRVAVASPDFAYLLNGTPAEAWLGAVQRGGVSPGSVPLGQNLSNLLRLALLYRYGGVYLDADVVVLRPFSGLRNVIGAQAVDEATGDWRRLNNAVMVFDRAHPLLREFIAEFAAAFDGSKWGHNGPYLVSRVAARLRHRGPGLNLTVLPPRAFYPVHWSKIGGLFVAPKDRKDERWVKAKVENIKGESFGIHLWNRESRRLEMEEGSVIGRLISDSCLFCNSSMFVKQE